MADPSELLARLATEAAASDAGDLPARLAEAARRLLGADGASITMGAEAAGRHTVHSTDAVAASLEDLHDVLGVGPATEATRTGEPVVVVLGRSEEEWSAFAEAASRQTPGVTVIAVPMRVGRTVLGALTLHHRGEGTLAEPIESVRVIADAVGAALLSDPIGAADLGGSGSWSNHAQIHQATGMVVAQLQVGAADAMAILRAHAFALDQPLGDVARAVVERRLVFGEDGRGQAE